MTILLVAAPIILGVVALQQLCTVIYFVIANRTRNSTVAHPSVADEDLPEAIVILKLRGADPFLTDCIQGLIQQDYPRYRVRIIVDNEKDPAWQIVHDLLSETNGDRVEILPLVAPALTCSLVCSALYQATEDLPDSCEAVVTLDSDVVPHATWLRELVAPLRDPGVGVSRGFRWFAPQVGKWGSWVRYVWNIVAEVTAYYCSIPWGGSLAMKASLVRDTDLRERWLRAANDDVPITCAMRQLNLGMRCVPNLVMVNREECDLESCLRFINRQQFWVRLYHPLPFWSNGLTFQVTVFAAILAVAASVIAAVQGWWLLAAVNLFSVVGYLGLQIFMVFLAEWHFRRVLATRGLHSARPGLKAIGAVLLTQFYSIPMVWRSITTRRYNWRGIDYEVDGPWKVRVVEYKPFTAAAAATAGSQTDSI